MTGSLPKPLLPVAGRPVVAHTLARLASLGCEATAMNLHHLGEQIEHHFGPSFGSMSLVYSWEQELLGTLGALGPLREFLGEADLILLVNGDSLCRWPLKRMVRRHLATGADATLLLAEGADPAEYGGGVGVNEEGRIVDLRSRSSRFENPQGIKRYVFAGAHVLSPRLLGHLTDGPGDVIGDLYEPLLENGGHLHGVTTKLCWHDLGTPKRYLAGAYDWARGRSPRRHWRRNWVAKSARVMSRWRLRGCVIESGVEIGRGTRVEQSLVLTDATVGPESYVSQTIVAQGVSLPAGTWVERRLITPLRAGRAPKGNDSVVGELVYTPIDGL